MGQMRVFITTELNRELMTLMKHVKRTWLYQELGKVVGKDMFREPRHRPSLYRLVYRAFPWPDTHCMGLRRWEKTARRFGSGAARGFFGA